MNQNWKQRIAKESIRLLIVFCVLMFICRLWPILLLGNLAIFVAIIRLLFFSVPREEVKQPMKPEFLMLPGPVVEPTEEQVINLAYEVIQKRITEKVCAEYPDARWVWETPNAKQKIKCEEDVFILLNRAGGYHKAKVLIQNLQVVAIEFVTAKVTEEVPDEEPQPTTIPVEKEEPVKENFELIAFEWVQANILSINAKCNEAIGEQSDYMVIECEDLPQEGSWENICDELINAGFEQVERISDGIKINLKQ